MTVIITICVLLLVAYLFDLTSSRTKIPSVFLLLLLGWVVRQITNLLDFNLPDFSSVLPILGTVGLILIVLEGSLELELNKSKVKLIRKSILGALFPMIAIAFLLAYLFQFFGGYSLKDSLVNAIPFCVISSAVAVPTVRHLVSSDREFVTYESSLSDIFGVLFFNFIALNDTFDSYSFGLFGLQLLIMIVVSFVATIGLSFLLNKIEHHIKFVPITLLVILIYSVSKIFHLPALIFILLFGLFLGNIDELKRFKWIDRLHPVELQHEVDKFRELTIEGSFLIRALFFLLFGYLIETAEILNTDTITWALAIVGIIFLFRAVQLKFSRIKMSPLLFVAPRGLITILLFLSIIPAQNISIVNESLVIQVILLTALVMMFGMMYKPKDNKQLVVPSDQSEAQPETSDKVTSDEEKLDGNQ